ncbi:HAD hydrolase-like protein [Kiritimatiellota bacterium B12222]|nr:HAD hydrolase-like protein [Kiritimatiellota bacterium B12222]
MKKVEHVFWDWNGTLLNDAWLCCDVMNGMLRERNMPEMSMEHYASIFDFPIEEYYLRVGFDFEKESFETLGLAFIDGYEIRRLEASLFEDVRSGLDGVKASGLGQSILSAYKQDTLVRLVHEHKLEDYFHDLHGHHHIYPVGKAPQGQEALDALGIDPGATVLIGDTTHDAEVAAELGMQCVLIPGGNQPEANLRACGVPVVASRVDALAYLGILV